jgi:tRNA threonylcarbamoyladenosine biosynthesis protein TsaE
MTVALRVLLDDPAATRLLGAVIAELLEGGDVVLLVGELGAGKTTLTKGLVGRLGGAEEVTSPTFTLMHLYECTPPVAHVDCWRLEDLADVRDLALEEVLDDGGVAVIEWGRLAMPLLGDDALIVTLDLAEETPGQAEEAEPGRVALLGASGERWTSRLSHLQTACRAAGLKSEVLGASLSDEATSSR